MSDNNFIGILILVVIGVVTLAATIGALYGVAAFFGTLSAGAFSAALALYEAATRQRRRDR